MDINRHENEGFKMTYSAAEQEELKKIRQKYQPAEEDKIAQVRKLDASVTQKATKNALIVGILGALVLGTGMSMIMSDLGDYIGLDGNFKLLVGICVGLVGMALTICAYPVYTRTIVKERGKIAPEILRLTEELMK